MTAFDLEAIMDGSSSGSSHDHGGIEINVESRFAVNFVFLSALTIILVGWCINWFLYRMSSGIKLHRFIFVTLLFQFVVSFLITLYYGLLIKIVRQCASDIDPITCEDKLGIDFYLGFYYAVGIISYSADGLFYSLLILIAKGWCIVHDELNTSFKLGLSGYVIAYVAAQLILLPGKINFKLVFFIAVIILFMYIGMIYYIFTNININIKKLTARRTPNGGRLALPGGEDSTTTTTSNDDGAYPSTVDPSTRDIETTTMDGDGHVEIPLEPMGSQFTPNITINPPEPETPYKLKLFKTFHFLMASYIILTMLCNLASVSTFTLELFDYIKYGLLVLFLAGICVTFRLRTSNQYVYLQTEE